MWNLLIKQNCRPTVTVIVSEQAFPIANSKPDKPRIIINGWDSLHLNLKSAVLYSQNTCDHLGLKSIFLTQKIRYRQRITMSNTKSSYESSDIKILLDAVEIIVNVSGCTVHMFWL